MECRRAGEQQRRAGHWSVAAAPVPAEIVQGRYDMICPPETAYDLAMAWPRARLTLVADAGHSALEPGVRTALVAAVERFRRRG